MLFRLLFIVVLSMGSAFAQRGGGSRSGGSSEVGAAGAMVVMPSVLDRMAETCKLSKDQKKQFKTILDAASKSAETLRKQIPLSRQQIGAAVQSGKSSDEIMPLVNANGLMRAQLSEMEFKAFGELYRTLDAEQKKVSAQRLLSLMTGILMKKNWNQ